MTFHSKKACYENILYNLCLLSVLIWPLYCLSVFLLKFMYEMMYNLALRYSRLLQWSLFLRVEEVILDIISWISVILCYIPAASIEFLLISSCTQCLTFVHAALPANSKQHAFVHFSGDILCLPRNGNVKGNPKRNWLSIKQVRSKALDVK